METLTHERLTIRAHVRLSDAQTQAIDHIARQEHRRRTDVIRIAVEEFVERRLAVPPAQKETT